MRQPRKGPQIARLMRTPAAFLVAAWTLAAAAAPAAAQEASPYLRLDDQAMPFVEHLIRSGVIADPDPLTRPLRRVAVAEALARADTTGLPPGVRPTMRRLLDELRVLPRGVEAGVSASLSRARWSPSPPRSSC